MTGHSLWRAGPSLSLTQCLSPPCYNITHGLSEMCAHDLSSVSHSAFLISPRCSKSSGQLCEVVVFSATISLSHLHTPYATQLGWGRGQLRALFFHVTENQVKPVNHTASVRLKVPTHADAIQQAKSFLRSSYTKDTKIYGQEKSSNNYFSFYFCFVCFRFGGKDLSP